jgi:hypothetical protein
MMNDPVIDTRSATEIIAQARGLGATYAPEWASSDGDRGMALLSIFARLMEIMISRLNRVPEKHFLGFLDTAGVYLLPPQAAIAPIRFFPTVGAKDDGVVLAGTQVATAPAPGQAALTFETETGLTVCRSRLMHLFSHNPARDMYADRQSVIAANEQNTDGVFAPFLGTDLIPHRLYLTQDTLFSIRQRTRLTLTFTLADMTADHMELFQNGIRWTIEATGQDITPASVIADLAGKTIGVVFDDPLLTTIDTAKVGGVNGYWLRAETGAALTPVQATLTIQSVQALAEAADIRPVMAFSNAAPLDIAREILPFGERPKTFDTFFLAIPEAFAKSGSRVNLHPDYNKGTQGASGVELTWEFWNGAIWEVMGVMNDTGTLSGSVNDAYHFTDTTKAFTADSGAGVDIRFDCPAVMAVEVNGKGNYWLRVRITSGNYGEDAKMELVTGAAPPYTLDKWNYAGPTFAPPVVKSLTASYLYTSGRDITAARTANNFVATPVDLNQPFQPFAVPEETQPACYFGFDSPFSSKTVSAYVAVEEGLQTIAPQVVWECWNGAGWQNLGAQDGTKNFTESGLVEFVGPADAAERLLFGASGWWLRARLEAGDQSAFHLLGLYINATWAKNCVTITGELLGSSAETPNALFTLSRFPVLEGLQIEVRETEPPNVEETAALLVEEGENAVTPAAQTAGASREFWVRWHQVNNLRYSGKKSRHYMLDWFSGQVQFGDGVHGMLPPAGRDNIRAAWYQAGGGLAGNVRRDTVSLLKRAIPFVDKAFNVDDAGGGSDGETVEHVKVRGPQTIKNRDRAVTWEDYEWLATEASFQVARARCLPAMTKDDAGTVTLILVPQADSPRPHPSQGLIRQVSDYINTRARRIATAELVIKGPKYLAVSVSASILPEDLEAADLVRRRVLDNLETYFHPLKGGADGQGWEFGRDVFVSEVSKVIEDTAGVHHSEGVRLAADSITDADHIPVADDCIVASGKHALTILRS